MEKIFHLDHLNQQPPQTQAEKVFLKRQHLCIDREIAQNAFLGERQCYAVYYDNLGMLLLAPMSDSMFKQAHECMMLMLKDRNMDGDKSISLQEILIDHDLPAEDRPLPFTSVPGVAMLQIRLSEKK